MEFDYSIATLCSGSRTLGIANLARTSRSRARLLFNWESLRVSDSASNRKSTYSRAIPSFDGAESSSAISCALSVAHCAIPAVTLSPEKPSSLAALERSASSSSADGPVPSKSLGDAGDIACNGSNVPLSGGRQIILDCCVVCKNMAFDVMSRKNGRQSLQAVFCLLCRRQPLPKDGAHLSLPSRFVSRRRRFWNLPLR